MTLRKALCQGYVTEEMLDCWAKAHNTTPLMVKRAHAVEEVAIRTIVVLMILLFGGLLAPLVPQIHISVWTIAVPVVVVLLVAVVVFGLLLSLCGGPSDFMKDVERLYRKVDCQPNSSRLAKAVEGLLVKEAHSVLLQRRIMEDLFISHNARAAAFQQHDESEGEFEKWHGLSLTLGLVEDESYYYDLAKVRLGN